MDFNWFLFDLAWTIPTIWEDTRSLSLRHIMYEKIPFYPRCFHPNTLKTAQFIPKTKHSLWKPIIVAQSPKSDHTEFGFCTGGTAEFKTSRKTGIASHREKKRQQQKWQCRKTRMHGCVTHTIPFSWDDKNIVCTRSFFSSVPRRLGGQCRALARTCKHLELRAVRHVHVVCWR